MLVCTAVRSGADDNNNNKKQTSNIWWILSLTKEEKLPLTGGVTGMTIASAMNVVFPRIMGKTIDVASGKPGSAARASWWWCSQPSSRARLYKVLLSQELAFYNNRKVGELVTRLSGECQQTANAVVDVLFNGYRSLNSAVGHKMEVQDLLSQHELPFVVFYTGLFAEFLPHFLGYPYDEGYMTVVGKGETASSITSHTGMGRFVAHVLSTAPKSALEGAKLAFEAERLSPLQIRDLRRKS
ncbi:hypothetical protein PF001_g25207 [Phytophthora fragariae]|uniref:ABC transmembrane type-1 domain-containing protein n=1 Tax=Phytophthora fragariae TaxID=53985 RepID=A0A6A3U0V5_9STRA|nr:hypothetical protein PF003_g12373 [Phytophthora fragariae]KAE8904592.1 hypothetical protein PF003_g11500 [Phytophthora fragariae]KAE8935826.1 hypothetical protein PF009_g14247 [Phytophthora fragariae]KAE9143204.1 hypothetical protein PF006_g11738 [Phytophthora fragariae]KAE9225004.1 hypothetical protein PF004_g12031 [Phytophthora fragariae]